MVCTSDCNSPPHRTAAHALTSPAARLSGCRGGSVTAAAEGTPPSQQFVPVATVLAGLRELRMSLSARLRCLALRLPQLTDLQLNNCADLQQLVVRCPRLERLSLQVG